MKPRWKTCITCGTKILWPASRCALHGGRNQGWTKYKLEHPERAAYYESAAWRGRRALHLRANPTCVRCGRGANHVDHIKPVAEGGALDGPLQSLCEEHHRAKTLAESHRGMKRKAERRRNR